MVNLGMAKLPPKTMSISLFKATCLAVLEDVRQSGTSIIITKRGVPVAEVIPPSLVSVGSSWLGSMSGSAELVGDVISPAEDVESWDVLK